MTQNKIFIPLADAFGYVGPANREPVLDVKGSNNKLEIGYDGEKRYVAGIDGNGSYLNVPLTMAMLIKCPSPNCRECSTNHRYSIYVPDGGRCLSSLQVSRSIEG